MQNKKITIAALIATLVLAICLTITWTKYPQAMWPAIAAMALHAFWVGVAFRQKLKISKDGIEVERDDDAN